MTAGWQDTVESHKARYREQIIDAAIELVAAEGLTKTSMARLAQRAGVGRATLYKYFPDVEHALLAHVERELDNCSELLNKAIAEHNGAEEKLRACLVTLVEYFASQQHRVGWASLDRAELSAAAMATVREQITKLRDPVVEIVAQGVRQQTFRSQLSPQTHGLMIFKVIASIHDELTAGVVEPAQAIDALWFLITRGIIEA